MFAVLLQRVHNGRLEVVDGDKVREEGQDVLNLNTRIKIISWLSPTQSNVIRQGRTQEGRRERIPTENLRPQGQDRKEKSHEL